MATSVPILDRPEERSQFWMGYAAAVQDDVPILDRPEERSQSPRFTPWTRPRSSNPRSPRRTIAIYLIGVRRYIHSSSNPRSPRRTIAIGGYFTTSLCFTGSNPRSPRRTIAIACLPGFRSQVVRFQSSIAPKNDRNQGRRSDLLSSLQFQSSIAPKNDRNHGKRSRPGRNHQKFVPILDRPEERSQ